MDSQCKSSSSFNVAHVSTMVFFRQKSGVQGNLCVTPVTKNVGDVLQCESKSSVVCDHRVVVSSPRFQQPHVHHCPSSSYYS